MVHHRGAGRGRNPGGGDVSDQPEQRPVETVARLTPRTLLLDCAPLMKILRFIPMVALAVCSGPRLHAEMVDGIMAVINDTVITRQQVEDYVGSAIDTLQRQYA